MTVIVILLAWLMWDVDVDVDVCADVGVDAANGRVDGRNGRNGCYVGWRCCCGSDGDGDGDGKAMKSEVHAEHGQLPSLDEMRGRRTNFRRVMRSTFELL